MIPGQREFSSHKPAEWKLVKGLKEIDEDPEIIKNISFFSKIIN